MASKIHTDNPNHHKFVSVNKRERKKAPKKLIRLLSLLFPKWMHEPGCSGNYHWGGGYKMDNAYKTKVIYDDCNHRSYRVMRKTANGWKVVGYPERTVPRSPWVRRYKVVVDTFRQSVWSYETRVRHFICR